MIRTRTDLLNKGVSASTISDRCRRGTYTRVLPGVYSLATPTTLTKCHAVVAWLPTAILSHRTAAWLHGMLPEPTHVEATIPKGVYRRAPDWLRLYRRELPVEWITDVYDLPTASKALTLLDCMSVLPKPAADALIDNNICRTVSPQDIINLSSSTLRGSSALRKQLREAAIHAASEPERLFARALHQRGLKLLANHPVGPYRCDFVDEQSHTIIEVDGREFHSTPTAFRQDRRRQNSLLLDGWLVLRYAAADIFQSLEPCADEAAEVVRRRRRSRRP
ncbi:MAG: hypothetical protein JWN03_1352 [Nocardia sp.]|uniref:DUF559 domain-containing protein n=1 Tax=Nocardia sp. TaxID=1821 RepID=UPI002618F7DB|nr:DUF559 domain-containing protein [Nocardia sp.]MCU1641077.1 hypothetical protein [Nocardia sp.]